MFSSWSPRFRRHRPGGRADQGDKLRRGGCRGVAASTGSACHSEQIEPSPVLPAMRVPEQIGMGAIRFSLGKQNTADEIDAVVARLATIVLS